MNWIEISYHATHENVDIISDLMMEAGSKGVLHEDSNTVHERPENQYGEIYRLDPNDYPADGVIVKGYLAVTPQFEEKVARLKERLVEVAPEAKTTLSIDNLAEEDWAESWKRHYEPIMISDNLMIKPSWLENEGKSKAVEILLDPGMAFGSGTHETTRLCLALLEKHITATANVVDVGTGSGILAIAAAKLGAAHVYGVDLDEMAVIRARENVALNDVDVQLETNDLIAGINGLSWQPNFIVANILAPIIIGMVPDVATVLEAGQPFICSGIIAEEKAAVIVALETAGFNIIEVAEENGWVAIVAKK